MYKLCCVYIVCTYTFKHRSIYTCTFLYNAHSYTYMYSFILLYIHNCMCINVSIYLFIIYVCTIFVQERVYTHAIEATARPSFMQDNFIHHPRLCTKTAPTDLVSAFSSWQLDSHRDLFSVSNLGFRCAAAPFSFGSTEKMLDFEAHVLA